MIVDGRLLAAKVLERTKARASRLSKPPLVVAIVGVETAATASYLKIKQERAQEAGCVFETRPPGSSFADADAALIQLPMADGVNQKELCDSIPIEKDADVLSTAARATFANGEPGALLPPVVAAIREIFQSAKVEPRHKKAVVVGKGWLVGSPAALWLGQEGAQVTVIGSRSEVLLPALAEADIVVSGVGSPHLIQSRDLKSGVVVIDAGTSESNGALAGDADPSCAEVASVFTPVPGGVGPIAVACLFENAVVLAEKATNT